MLQVNIFDINQDDPLTFSRLAGEAVVNAWSLPTEENGELRLYKTPTREKNFVIQTP